MIRRLLAPLALLPLLTAATCSRDVRPAVEFPQLPDLSAETRAACPAAEQVTGQLGDLAAKDAALAIQYAQCRQKHSTAVQAYGTAQQLLRDADAKAKAAETAAKPR